MMDGTRLYSGGESHSFQRDRPDNRLDRINFKLEVMNQELCRFLPVNPAMQLIMIQSIAVQSIKTRRIP